MPPKSWPTGCIEMLKFDHCFDGWYIVTTSWTQGVCGAGGGFGGGPAGGAAGGHRFDDWQTVHRLAWRERAFEAVCSTAKRAASDEELSDATKARTELSARLKTAQFGDDGAKARQQGGLSRYCAWRSQVQRWWGALQEDHEVAARALCHRLLARARAAHP